MRHWAPLLIALLAAGLFSPSTSAVPEVLSFSEDVYYAGVSPDDPEYVQANATLRNPYPEDSTFLLEASIPSSPTWGIDVADKVAVPARGQRTVQLKVFIPRGEPAFEESELRLEATEAQRGASWQAECRIRITPYLSCSVLPVDEVLVDMPLSGSFNVTLMNDGNAGRNMSLVVAGELYRIEVAPGGFRTFPVPYEVSEDAEIVIEPVIEGAPGTALVSRAYIDGERAHLLFGLEKALVVLPAGPNAVRVLPIGGPATLKGASADDGTPIGIGSMEVGNLERAVVRLDPGKDPLRRTVQVRVRAVMGEEEVESNPIPVLLLVRERDGRTLGAATYAAGGAGGAAAVAVASFGYLYAAVEGFRYRWLALAFIPLYSVVHGEKVLDHFFRGRLYEYIKENPGVTFTALKKHFEVNNGNLTYHLHRLEREELIVSRTQGKFKLFYPDGIKLGGTEIVISLLDKDILDMVSASPGIASLDVIRGLSIERSKRTVSRHIKELERKGLVEAYGENRKLYISRNYGSAVVKDGGRLMLDDMAPT